ncbi:MAG: YbjN domain-containing protein, partial [Bacteroidetes bacterium]|nr:YbjN domain-containing protein [Bacteroidota bacterium]
MANIVNATRQKVKRYLKNIYGKNYRNIVEEVDESFVIRRGSATVHVTVKPLSKDDCIVDALSYVVQGAKIGPKLLGMLMRRNSTYPIGAYGLLFDDTIVFSHSIAGANLDPNELRTTIATVAFVADET